MYISRNRKQEKTGPKNKGARKLCKEANKQIVKNCAGLIEALCNRVKKDGSPETMNCLIRLAEMLDLNEKAETHERKQSILDLWEAEPEWTGEADETTAETASGIREPEAANTSLGAAAEIAAPEESTGSERLPAANPHETQREDSNKAASTNTAVPTQDQEAGRSGRFEPALKGHGFSRAVNGKVPMGALAPEGWFSS